MQHGFVMVGCVRSKFFAFACLGVEIINVFGCFAAGWFSVWREGRKEVVFFCSYVDPKDGMVRFILCNVHDGVFGAAFFVCVS